MLISISQQNKQSRLNRPDKPDRQNKPDGQPGRKLDISRVEQEFGFWAPTSLEEGIKKTIDLYRDKK